MNKMLIVNGRPFAGKRIFANKVVNSFEQFVALPLISSAEKDKRMTLFSYYSQQEKSILGANRIQLMDLADEGKIPVVVCNNTVTAELLLFCKEYDYSARTIFVDADLSLSLSRYFERCQTDNLSREQAEILSDKIVEIIHEEQYSQHHIAFDMVIKAKQIEKAGVKKIPKLFEQDDKARVEVLKRFSTLSRTSHTVGLKALIFNQLNAYGMINEVTIDALVNAIVLCVESYKSRIEEEL